MVDSKVLFKRVQQEDVDLLFQWINDPEVRSQSLVTSNIPYEEHVSWFSRKLVDRNCYLYIVYSNDVPAGMLRFDVKDDECSVSYLVDKLYRGKGLGGLIIKYGLKRFYSDSCFKGTITAIVKSTNVASLKIFEKEGFNKFETGKGLIQFKMCCDDTADNNRG